MAAKIRKPRQRLKTSEKSEQALTAVICNLNLYLNVKDAEGLIIEPTFDTTKPTSMKHFFILLIPVVVISCHFVNHDKVRGNGTIKTESRTAGSFTGVDVGGNIDLYVKQDSIRSVRVEADENLMQYIEVKMEGEKLVIQPKEGYNLSGSKAIKVYVSSPVFKTLEASGACDIIGENKITSTEPMHIDLSGASDVKLELKAPKVLFP
jgi:Putative auto-transporter adhesin, head GIN domain